MNTGNTDITTYYEPMYSHVPVYCSTKDNATLASKYIQGVTGGMCETSGECFLGQTIPI